MSLVIIFMKMCQLDQSFSEDTHTDMITQYDYFPYKIKVNVTRSNEITPCSE